MSKRSPIPYFRASPEIIRLAVIMYFRSPPSLRNVEDLLHEQGIEVSHKTVRSRCMRFGPMFAVETRRKRVGGRKACRWQWHLDRVSVKVNGTSTTSGGWWTTEGEDLESYVTKHQEMTRF